MIVRNVRRCLYCPAQPPPPARQRTDGKTKQKGKQCTRLQVWNQVRAPCTRYIRTSLSLFVGLVMDGSNRPCLLVGFFFFRATACQTSNPMNACRPFEWKSTQGGLFTLLVSSGFFFFYCFFFILRFRLYVYLIFIRYIGIYMYTYINVYARADENRDDKSIRLK